MTILYNFIRYLSKNLGAYIAYNLADQLSYIKRYKLYKSLISNTATAIPFYIIVIDFIIELPNTSAGINYLLTIIYKFIKRVLLKLGKEI